MQQSLHYRFVSLSVAVPLLAFAACGGEDDTPWGERPVPVTGVSLSRNELTTRVGATEVLTASVQPSNATNKARTWASDNPTVASVVEGTVTAHGAGAATITVTTSEGGKTAHCSLTVITEPIPVVGVTLPSSEITLTLAETRELVATVLPANASNKAVQWTSSNPDVAPVFSNGLVAPRALGVTIITVATYDGNFTASCLVRVTGQ